MPTKVRNPEITDTGFEYRGAVGAGLSVACLLWTLGLFLGGDSSSSEWRHLLSMSAAWALMLAGGGMRLWATVYVGGRKNHNLVTEGPYSICRNPLYLGTFLILASGCFFLESAAAVVGAAAIAAFYYFGTIPSEERYLEQRWGAEFDAYRERVPRLLPRLSGFCTSSHIPVKVHCLWLEAKRMWAWIWLPVLGEFLHYWRG